MAARVTSEEVLVILSDPDITEDGTDSFILAATALVDNVLGSDTTLLASLKKEIERWLAAHLIASTVERMASKAEAGGAKIEYTGAWDKRLDSTPYGQMVLTLDSTGKMASLGSKEASAYAIPSFDE